MTSRGSPCRWEQHSLKSSMQAETSVRRDAEFTLGLFTEVPRDPPGKTKSICIQRPWSSGESKVMEPDCLAVNLNSDT